MHYRGNHHEVTKYLELNKNKRTIYHNLRGVAKTALRGKFIALAINEFSVQVKHLEKVDLKI